MKGCINNKMGQIQIDTDVIALYAGTTAVECFGIMRTFIVYFRACAISLAREGGLSGVFA